jgi:hypothetical protein
MQAGGDMRQSSNLDSRSSPQRIAAVAALVAVVWAVVAVCPCPAQAGSAASEHDCCAPASSAAVSAAPDHDCGACILTAPPAAFERASLLLAPVLAFELFPAPAAALLRLCDASVSHAPPLSPPLILRI